MTPANKPRVLCVDDEPRVLEGLALTLRRSCEVLSAPDGEEALRTLQTERGIAVVVSDMRMSGMNGTQLLARARDVAPDATRVLLTGHAEVDAAIAAINEGHVFRFLTKPCPPAVLVPAIAAAAEQHRLVTAERVLLEQTLRGSVRMLMDVLALAAPVAFGRAMRIKRRIEQFARGTGRAPPWYIEVAAMLSQLGCIALHPDTLDKLNAGAPLGAEEQAAVERMPALAVQLLADIPRLESVTEILKHYRTPFEGGSGREPHGKGLPVGARALHIIVDFDDLELSGLGPDAALGVLRSRPGQYDPDLLETFASIAGTGTELDVDIQEIALREVRVGMTFVEDVRTKTGVLLVPRGYEATYGLMERIRNFPKKSVREPVRISMRRRLDGGGHSSKQDVGRGDGPRRINER